MHHCTRFQSLLLAMFVALTATVSPVQAVAETAPVPLSTIQPDWSTQGFGTLMADKSVGGNPLRIAGKAFATGLGTHAASEIVYDVDGEFDALHAWVGVDDEVAGNQAGSVIFQVFGDGQKLFDSGVLRVGDAAKPVEVKLAGVSQLKLVVTDAGDGTNCDHADWAGITLTRAADLGEAAAAAQPAKYEVKAPGLTVRLDAAGNLVNCLAGDKQREWPLMGKTLLAHCTADGDVTAKKSGAGMRFTRRFVDAQNHAATVTETFTPTQDSVRWEIDVAGEGAPWTTDIQTFLHYVPTAQSRFWTTWGHPDNAPSGWVDPLEWRPFATRTWPYQFPDWTRQDLSKQCISMPLFTVAEPDQDCAVTVAQSPEDILLDLTLRERKRGDIELSRTNYRLSADHPVHFAVDLVGHAADSRAGLGWYVGRYPQFFDPGLAAADRLSGSTAYSGNENPINVPAFQKMAFSYNWKLSDDFPYMGLFIPPVKDADQRWKRSGDAPAPPNKGPDISCRQMNDYAEWMKKNGFHVLSYFNTTEFGKNVPWPLKPDHTKNADDAWANPSNYLTDRHLVSAVLMNGKQPFYSNAYGALILDPGDPGYEKHLVEQARRNTELLPATDGICIDRTDWLNQYNRAADDGVSWIDGKPARSLFLSWKGLMGKLAPELHQAGQVVFVNNCSPRIEVVGLADGIFAEWASDTWKLSAYVNYAALTGMRKPVCLWTTDGETSDFYMQRLLYLGVYPIAPYPDNDHCVTPSAEGTKMTDMYAAAGADRKPVSDPNAKNPEAQCMAYGPLMEAYRGKKWVLAPHCIETVTPHVKVNLFQVPAGYALPVVFGGDAASATVRVRNLPGLESMQCAVLHPDGAALAPLEGTLKDGVLELIVPLQRGCAMVQLSKR
jgi:hypothetical protein